MKYYEGIYVNQGRKNWFVELILSSNVQEIQFNFQTKKEKRLEDSGKNKEQSHFITKSTNNLKMVKEKYKVTFEQKFKTFNKSSLAKSKIRKNVGEKSLAEFALSS